ncbi:MAG: efflux transporter outer membrane subunit [Burkholderiales bacterium]|nr:efflux transporter outer membrane subunit [Burkholderiales bacterium]
MTTLARSTPRCIAPRALLAVLHKLLPTLLPILLLSACAVQPPVPPADQPLPAQWAEAASVSPQAAAVDRAWWTGFGSPQLVRLVAQAEAGSADLRIAAQRLRQAEIAWQQTDIARLPVALTAATGRTGFRTDAPDTPAVSGRDSGTELNLSISYEVDLWGRVAAGLQASELRVAASRYDLDAARLSLQSTVAQTYFQWLATQERLRIARENVAIAERVLRIVEARWRNGVATPLEVSQQRSTVLTQQTALVPLEVQLRQTESALALLMGAMPQAGAALQPEGFMDLTIPEVAPMLPSELLLRRPDLAASEAQLAAARADVVAARAELLPSVALTGSAGLGTTALLSLANPTTTAAISLSLAHTVFDRGRLRLQAEGVESQWLVLLETYRSAVRTAFKEVDDGLSNADRSRRQELLQRELVEQAQRSLRLAELRYREGAGDLLAVLDAQRGLFSAQEGLVTQRLDRLVSTLDLYKALGGGWQRDEGLPLPKQE